MATNWTLTIDCEHPAALAAFWIAALGYEEAAPPEGFAGWPAWFEHYGVRRQEWDDGAYLVDPAGNLPRISFLKVPESKVFKNRLHLDIQIGGGRGVPWEERWPRAAREVERLTSLGAAVIEEVRLDGKPDHVVMADPEGNEFCVL